MPCFSPRFYYCSNATEVVSVSVLHGHAAGARFWLNMMEANMNDDAALRPFVPGLPQRNSTLRRALEARSRQLDAFVSGVLPRSAASLPVLYPFSGMVRARGSACRTAFAHAKYCASCTPCCVRSC